MAVLFYFVVTLIQQQNSEISVYIDMIFSIQVFPKLHQGIIQSDFTLLEIWMLSLSEELRMFL